MLNLIIFGPPGSGKGTQSAKIVDKYNLIHLSTGDILREEIKAKSKLGLKVKKYLSKGALVPDSIIIDELAKKVVKYIHSTGVIFDGFPRTLIQANMFDKMLAGKNISISLVIAIDVTEKEILTRLLGRAKNSNRDDDNKKIILNRIEVYKKQTLPLIQYYKNQKKLVSISGMANVDNVFERISKFIDNYLKMK
jgi:adenylate kinase